MRKHITFTAAGAAAALLLAACGSSQPEATVASGCKPVVSGVTTAHKGELTMAVAEYPPYVSLKGDKLSGVDGELLAQVAAKLCLVPKPQTQSFTAIIESVKNGSADLTAGNWYINDERKSLFEISKPVYQDKMALLTKDGATKIDDLKGQTAGTPQGYLWVDDLKKALGTNHVKLYASEDAVFQDVKNGRIQAGVITFGAGTHLLESNKASDVKLEVLAPDDRVKSSVDTAQTAVLVHKGNAQLAQAVNQVVEAMRADGSLAALLKKNGLPAEAAQVK